MRHLRVWAFPRWKRALPGDSWLGRVGLRAVLLEPHGTADDLRVFGRVTGVPKLAPPVGRGEPGKVAHLLAATTVEFRARNLAGDLLFAPRDLLVLLLSLGFRPALG